MSSQITKLVLVPLEEWKRLNKNGVRGDTYTTIEIPSSKPRNHEGRGIIQEEKEELNPPPPISHHPTSQDNEELGGAPLPPLLPSSLSSPPPPKREEGKGEGGRRRKGGIEIIRNVGNRPPGKRVSMKKRKKYVYFTYYSM